MKDELAWGYAQPHSPGSSSSPMTASVPTGCSLASTQPPLGLLIQVDKGLNQGTGCGFCPSFFPAASSPGPDLSQHSRKPK